jgi:hypothetical protein
MPPAANYGLTRPALLGGRPRGLFSVMIAPRAKISPPQTPWGSCRSTAPARQAGRIGQGRQYALASCRSAGTADETAALLRRGAAVSGVTLPETAADALTARTEGWAAGLQLAALSLRGQPDAAGFVAAFTGSHRYVLDFLAEEVLEHQSEQVRTFLPETSVLERLSGELCDAVTGRPGSQALLEQAERAGCS